ncbi:hypothetical protein ABU162_01385 [Paenibacillus thiaminolyticus]|uniref:hypothetical protein n=1 Tax=Paenibacillus thiaminolyticus TaxID=49283 RepID=UPI0035A67553
MRAHFFKDNNKGHESETLSFQTEDGQFIAIDMKTGKPVPSRFRRTKLARRRRR